MLTSSEVHAPVTTPRPTRPPPDGMYWTQGLHRSLQQHPDAPATIFRGRVRSFRAQADRVSRLAGALRGLGVRDGDQVAVCALTSDRYVELQLATRWANGVLVPLDRRWRPGEIADALADSAARIPAPPHRHPLRTPHPRRAAAHRRHPTDSG
jgi:acyl-CoA synthetase (AMP-forming)/AMP-acid ligase II